MKHWYRFALLGYLGLLAATLGLVLMLNYEARIDFIYYVGDKIRPVSSEIYMARWNETLEVNGQTSMYPSDHGFVLTTFEWVGEARR